MENPIAKKLDLLLKLQQIDSKLDEIDKVRGDLPEEVQDLEDEIAGYETRISKFQSELKELETEINNLRQAIKDSEKLIEKYEKQQSNVRNDREFQAIGKEIELQHLEVASCRKKIKEVEFKTEGKKTQIADTDKVRQERQKDIDNKRKELDVIIAESEDEKQKLFKEREKKAKTLEDRLLRSYERLRGSARNGLAVVIVRRDACGGCFNIVPPQRQADIKDKIKIIVCEHCGRILADVVDKPAEPEKVKKAPVSRKKREEAEAEEEATA